MKQSTAHAMPNHMQLTCNPYGVENQDAKMLHAVTRRRSARPRPARACKSQVWLARTQCTVPRYTTGSNFSCVGMTLLRICARLARSLPAESPPGATDFRFMPRL